MTIGPILAQVIQLYVFALIAWVVLSWFPRARRHPLARPLERICEPPLSLAGRVIPSTGGLDFSPVLVIVLLEIVARAVSHLP